MTFAGLTALAAVVTLLTATPAHAIHPQEWVHSSEADFEGGQKQGTVITNLGDIKLAIGSRTLAELPEEGSIIYDLQMIESPNGERALYLAAGPQAKLLRQTDDGVETVLELPSEQIFALARTEAGELVVAISGQPSRLAVLDPATGDLETLVELPSVRYIWEVLVEASAEGGEPGALVVATGTDGKVLRVRPQPLGAEANGPNVPDVPDDPDEEQEQEPQQEQEQKRELPPGVEVLLETRQANVLSLAYDRTHNRYYAGTDTEGLIYRIGFNDAGEPEPFVVYDAPEPEIGALVVARDGTLYAGTADAEQARPGRLEDARRDPAGRPGEPAPMTDEPMDPEDMPLDPEDVPEVPPKPEPIEDEAIEEEPLDAPEDAHHEGENDAELPPGVNGPNGGEDEERPEPDAWEDLEALGDVRELDDLDEGEASGVDGPPARPVSAEPTAEQRDQLRQEIRQRLERARAGGELQVQPAEARRAPSRAADAPSRAQPTRRDRRSQDGNAIYRIDADGFVTEVFRESVMILDMVHVGDRLLVATGNQGQLYSVRPGADEKSMIVELDPEQIAALLPGPGGELLLGTANPAHLVRLDRDYARRGEYVSPVLDADQISLWGKLRLTARIPSDTSLTIETRSGNVHDPEHGPWSDWSPAQVFMPNEAQSSLQPRKMEVHSPPARFIQYRLSLTGNRDTTPEVSRVALAYVMPNMPPRIRSVRAEYPDRSGSGGRNPRGGGNEDVTSPIMHVRWEASDPNDDRLVYKLEYRPAGSDRFLLVEEGIERNEYEWNTRRVPDGWYVLRITASDHLDNPSDMAMTASRLSDPVLVDNAQPWFEGLDQEVAGDSVTLSGLAVDRHSRIVSIAYALNNASDYEPILPDDLIFDSTRERWSVTLSGLEAGQHVVTLRVRDQRGNTAYESLIVEVD